MWQWILTFLAAWMLALYTGCAPASPGTDPGPCDGLFAGRSVSGDDFVTPLRGVLDRGTATWVLGSTTLNLTVDESGTIMLGDDTVGTLDLDRCEGSGSMSLGDDVVDLTFTRVPCSPDNDVITDELVETAAIFAGRWVLGEPNIPAQLATLEFDEDGLITSMDYPGDIGLIGVPGTYLFDGQSHDLPDGSGTYSAETNTFLDAQNDACLGFTLDMTQGESTRQVAWLFSGKIDTEAGTVSTFWLENLVEGEGASTNSFFVIDWVREE